MSKGIVIHVEAGAEKRTEFFSGESIKLGTDENCDLRLEPPDGHALAAERGVWLELRRDNGFYSVNNFKKSLDLKINDQPLAAKAKLRDGDAIDILAADVQLQFFAVNRQSGLTATTANASAATAARDSRPMRFIETAAIESAASAKRDDAKVFLREFVRELVREISWLTKLVTLVIVIGALSGVFYLGFSLFKELQRMREVNEQQGKIISDLNDKLGQNSTELQNLNKTNETLIGIVGLAPKLRNDYGSGVCLLFGTYDLVDKQTGKQLRYPDPATLPVMPETDGQAAATAAPTVSESGSTAQVVQDLQPPLTTEGYGTLAEFDFVGTGFHVGSGYVLTNRHVVQPWSESAEVKMMAQLSNGRARLRKIVVYFPGFSGSFPLKVREVSFGEDLAVGSLDPNMVFPDIPILPLDTSREAETVGKTVVTMGYPNGPERILAMVDAAEVRQIQTRYPSLQAMLGYLSQNKRITPLLTQGTITDLDSKSIAHDAKTAEGGSGAPLFGQSGRVIGVNFGVFTENAAANMAVPIRYALPLLKRAGWKSAEEIEQAAQAEKQQNGNQKNDNQNTNSNAGNAQKNARN